MLKPDPKRIHAIEEARPVDFSPPEVAEFTMVTGVIGAQNAVVHTALNGDGEEHMLTNRTLEQTDFYLGNRLLSAVLRKLHENPGRIISILDIGGGALSTVVRDLLKHPLLRGKIKATNVDPFAIAPNQDELLREGIESPSDLLVLEEKFLDATIQNESIDVVLCYQVLETMSDEKKLDIVDRVSRILARGGEAYLDDLSLSILATGSLGYTRPYIGRGNQTLQAIAETYNVVMMPIPIGDQRQSRRNRDMVLHIGKTYSAEGHTAPNPNNYADVFHNRADQIEGKLKKI